jgi:AmiR/NasT family two-component response regulator
MSTRSKPSRILIAEDESLIRMGLCRILEEAGYQVVAAPDGPTAVKLARQTGPDLAILDIMMPGQNGLEVAQRIYTHRPLPIVILTAYGDRDLVGQATTLPVMAYLIKPVKEQELLATVEVAMARFAEHRWLINQTNELEEKLAARKVVERAKGVLMQRDALTEKEAYQAIQRQARKERRSMRQVAEAILRKTDD